MLDQITLFISHTTRDERDSSLAHKIGKALEVRGVKVWVAPESIPIGSEWEEELVRAIVEKCKYFLVILSAASVRSEWVLKEIQLAKQQYDLNKSIKVLPLIIGKLDSFEGDEFIGQFQKVPFYDELNLQIDAVAGSLGLSQDYRDLFINRVADIYQLLHYEVERRKLFDGRQATLFLSRKIGDLMIYRAVECLVDEVDQRRIDDVISTLRAVQRTHPSAQGTIISNRPIDGTAFSYAKGEAIHIETFGNLEAQLLDGYSYANNLIREIRTSVRYPLDFYIKPFVGYESIDEGMGADEIVKEWLEDSEWNQLTLLGDVGTGKSFFTRVIAHKLAAKYLQNPLEHPLPILIDLRNADRRFSLEGLVLTHFARTGLNQVTFDIFQHALTNGRIILILDGFDEMAARVTRQVTTRNFYELARCVQGRAKVLLTCRTHYFKSRTEEEEIILGGSAEFDSETARDLYWELIARKGYKIAYLKPFTASQVEEYVRRVKPETAKQAIEKIRRTYNLIELSQRPMLLEMIVKSLDTLNQKDINTATLYKVFTNAWIHRDQWRDVLPPEAKESFLITLSSSLWDNDAISIHYSELFEHLKQEFSSQVQDQRQLLEIDNEIRTASFLTRDDGGNYSFAHRSYAEYFLARHIANELTTGRTDCLSTRRLTPEVISFLQYMVKGNQIEPLLENILCTDYYPLLSENALICLYGLRRNKLLVNEGVEENKKHTELIVQLPKKMQLQGAQLEQVTLEGALLIEADLREANLMEAVLDKCNLQQAALLNANLLKASLTRASLNAADLSNAIVMEANLGNANLSAAILFNTDLRDSYLLGAQLSNVDFSSALLKGAILPEAQGLVSQKDVLSLDNFKKRLGQDTEVTREFWEIIENAYPTLRRHAKIHSLKEGVAPEDIVSETIIELSSPQNIRRLLAAEPADRNYILYRAIKRVSSYRRKQLQGTDSYQSITPDLEEEDAFYYIEDEYNHLATNEASPVDKIFLAEILSEIHKILSERLWRIFKAKYVDDLDIDEISVRENLHRASVARALNKAREVIAEHFNRADFTQQHY